MSNFGTQIEDYGRLTVKQKYLIFVRLCLLLAPLAWVTACGEKTPEGILSRQEMVKIMEDLYLSEEKVNHLSLSRDSAKQVAAFLQEKVFESSNVNDSVFMKSFDYYMERPAQLELIYTALVDTLQLREQRAPLAFPEHQ